MLESPYCLRDSTEMSIDPFSDILRLTSAEAVMTGGFSAGCDDWAISFPAKDKIKFFAIVTGSCWLLLEGEPEPILFETGDVGLLAARRSFVVTNRPGVEPIDAMSLFSAPDCMTVKLGRGDAFSYIGGHVTVDPTRGRLLSEILPVWIHSRAAAPETATFRWLIDRLVVEKDTALHGSQLASAQLTQLLFIQILRSHLNSSSHMPPGWLRALADPRVAPALRLMHGHPDRAWHLEELARSCAMSRTSFALHFRNVAGVAPLTYLAEWRMRLAERALREEKTPVASVARSLGYTSESAFSNAFKRIIGISPTAYRTSLNVPGMQVT